MQREALTQPSRLLAAVTSSCPQPRQCQTEERRVPATDQRSKREEWQNATHRPRHRDGLGASPCRSRPTPAPGGRGSPSGKWGGEGEAFPTAMIRQLFPRVPHLYFAIPSADRKGANCGERPRSICTGMLGYFRWGSGCSRGRMLTAAHPPERLGPSAAAAVEAPVCFLVRTWVDGPFASLVFEILKAKFQLTCGPERISNTSLSHSSSLLAGQTAS